jgi:hypothetical protein
MFMTMTHVKLMVPVLEGQATIPHTRKAKLKSDIANLSAIGGTNTPKRMTFVNVQAFFACGVQKPTLLPTVSMVHVSVVRGAQPKDVWNEIKWVKRIVGNKASLKIFVPGVHRKVYSKAFKDELGFYQAWTGSKNKGKKALWQAHNGNKPMPERKRTKISYIPYEAFSLVLEPL